MRSGGTERHSLSSQDTETITSQTGSVTAFTCCNKEHSCPITYSFYRCESCGHRITRASSTEPSSHSGHSLGHYTCPGRPMPQQSYPLANLTVRPHQAAHWYSTVLPIPPNPRLPIYSDLHNYSPSRMNVLVHYPSPREVDLYQAVFGILRVQIGSLVPM